MDEEPANVGEMTVNRTASKTTDAGAANDQSLAQRPHMATNGIQPASQQMTAGTEVDGRAVGTVMYLTVAATAAQAVSELGAQYFAKDHLGMGPASMDFYLSFYAVGWVIKPVWGFITDSYPIFVQTRKPYLMLALSLGAVGFLSYDLVRTPMQFLAVLIFTNICMAFMSVIAQALLVQRSGGKSLNGAAVNFTHYYCVKTSCMASLTLFAGWLITFHSARCVLMSTSFIFFGVFLFTPLMRETPAQKVMGPSEQLTIISGLFGRREFLGVIAYIVAFTAKPHSQSAMFYFNTNRLGYSPRFIATLTICGSMAQLTGYMLYKRFLTHVPFAQLSRIATPMLAVVSTLRLIQIFRFNCMLGLGDRIFTLAANFVLVTISEVLWLPMLVLASRLCPASVEATTFSIWLSVHNLGIWMSGVASFFLTAALGITHEDLSNLWVLIVLCSLATLLPLIVLPLLEVVDAEAARRSNIGMNADGSAANCSTKELPNAKEA